MDAPSPAGLPSSDFDAPAGKSYSEPNLPSATASRQAPRQVAAPAAQDDSLPPLPPLEEPPYDPEYDDYVSFPPPAAAPLPPSPAPSPVVGEPMPAVALTVPAPMVRWAPADYQAGGVGGYNAEKLVTSAIAPLVAAARGYETFDSSTIDEAFAKHDLGRKNSRQGRRVVDALGRADLMVMPWYTPDEITRADRFGNVALPSSIQYRPARPSVNEEGRELKYEFVVEHHSPLGVHPAIPADWIDSCHTVLIAEGLLKGDAALSGMLLDAGITPGQLRYDDASTDARAQLAALMNTVPTAKRVLVLTIAGVWNWQKNPEWRSLLLKGRDVWIGIDGDVASNPHVHLAATRIFDYIRDHHKATPKLLSPKVVTTDAGELSKIGIDDYLAEVGTWASLLEGLTDELPPAPAGQEVTEVGAVRINETGTVMEKCEPISDPATGQVTGARWVQLIPMGGRVLSIVAEREPSNAEIASGAFGVGVSADRATYECEVEVAWENSAGDIERHIVRGPAGILMYTPDQWDRRGAKIPAPVLRNPEWPPSRAHGESWLKAIKANRHDETAERVRWLQMGWVPVAGGVPAFVIGEQVIGGGDTDTEVLPGIGELELAGATRFGVGPIDDRSFDDEEYREQVRRDFAAVMDTYVHGGAWTDKRVAAVVLAAGLRPALPLRAQTSIYFVGPRRKGKSYTAGAIAGFWACLPGEWSSNRLMGSAKDTIASTEDAVSRCVLWVADDLAPSTSARQAANEAAALGDLIRNIHNGSGKRRKNADGTSREVRYPKALLIATAENDPTVSSVGDRALMINIGYGSLCEDRGPTNAIDALHMRDGAPARLSQALVKYIRHLGATSAYGWADVYRQIAEAQSECQLNAADLMAASGAKVGDAKRAADMAGDLMVALQMAGRMAADLGMDDAFVTQFGLRGLAGDIVGLSADGHEMKNETTPGKAVLAAVAAILRRGRAHLVNADDPAVPPGDNDGSAFTAQLLGWQRGSEGSARPCGEAIGVLVHPDGVPTVLLDASAAFNLAQQLHPELLPSGQGQRSSWGSVWGEGLASAAFREVSGHAGGSKKASNTVRISISGQRYSGVPVPLDVLLSGGNAIAGEDEL